MFIIESEGVKFPAHKLKNGLVIVLTSKHGYKFSDGSFIEIPQDIDFEYLDKLNIIREFKVIQENPFRITESTQRISDDGLKILKNLQESKEIDIILVPQILLSALREMGIRNQFSKVVGFNSTPETSRTGSPLEKIVDVNNWAW